MTITTDSSHEMHQVFNETNSNPPLSETIISGLILLLGVVFLAVMML